MKTIEVAAGIIIKEGKILATRRGYGKFINLWEFPGGKIEPGETKEAALLREIYEELKVAVSIDHYLYTINYDYPDFHLTMHCFICSITRGEITLVEHNAAKWLTADTLDSVEWLPADVELIEVIRSYLLQRVYKK